MNKDTEHWIGRRQQAFLLARRRLRDEHDAWQAVDDAQLQFAAIVKSYPDRDTDSLFLTIAVRRAIDIVRENQRRNEVLETDLVRDNEEGDSIDSPMQQMGGRSATSPLDELIHQEERDKLPDEKRKLHQEMDSLIEEIKAVLTPDEWSAVDMCLGKGIGQAEIAARLSPSEYKQMTQNAVKMKIRSARKKAAPFLQKWKAIRARLAYLKDGSEYWSSHEID